MIDKHLPIAIIGAGPVGLAAAAHLIERGENPILFEAGASVGQNVRNWGHVRMFSPWEYTVDSATVRLLEADGWTMPPLDELPTGDALVDRYMTPFAELDTMQGRIQLNSRVVGVSRQHTDKMKDANRSQQSFILHIETADGDMHIVNAKAVIDASGTWSNPNPIGAHGIAASGENKNRDAITYGIPDIKDKDADTYANQRVMVVGSGHSAINAILDLASLQETYPDTEIYWAMRSVNLAQVYGGGDDDQLPARGALGTRVKALVDNGHVQIVSPFYVTRIQDAEGGLCVESDNGKQVLVDRIIGTTGARPDLAMLRELRLDLDSSLESTRTLAPLIDPNIHSCGTVPPHGEAELRHPEENFYMVGMKSYGRAPSFLLATGYEQVRSVAAYLTGDYEAAKDVQLNLPETGVCSTDFVDGGAACCGTTSEVAVEPVGTIQLLDISVGSKASGSSCC